MSFLKLIPGLAVLILASCAKPFYNQEWQATPVTADGNAKEWSVPLGFYDGETKIQYTFSNDINNLYLCMKVVDEKTQVKIIRAGLQLWIDSMGKNKHQTGVLFPMANPDAGGDSKSGEGRDRGRNSGDVSSEKKSGDHKPDIGALKRKFFNAPKEMQLTGFKPPLGGLTSMENNNDISININWDSTNTLVYEAIIPFKTFYKKSLSLSDTTVVLGITVTVNGLPAPAGSGGGGSGGGGGRGMGGGGMGGAGGMGGGGMGGAGGMGGGGMGGRGGNKGGGARPTTEVNPLYETTTLKTQLKLATSPGKPRPSMGVW